MSRKIITFLGKYPKETRYRFRDETYSGQVFPEALRRFVEFDEMLVFVTEEARKYTWPVTAQLWPICCWNRCRPASRCATIGRHARSARL